MHNSSIKLLNRFHLSSSWFQTKASEYNHLSHFSLSCEWMSLNLHNHRSRRQAPHKYVWLSLSKLGKFNSHSSNVEYVITILETILYHPCYQLISNNNDKVCVVVSKLKFQLVIVSENPCDAWVGMNISWIVLCNL